jgi:hypothetical protein
LTTRSAKPTAKSASGLEESHRSIPEEPHGSGCHDQISVTGGQENSSMLAATGRKRQTNHRYLNPVSAGMEMSQPQLPQLKTQPRLATCRPNQCWQVAQEFLLPMF